MELTSANKQKEIKEGNTPVLKVYSLEKSGNMKYYLTK